MIFWMLWYNHVVAESFDLIPYLHYQIMVSRIQSIKSTTLCKNFDPIMLFFQNFWMSFFQNFGIRTQIARQYSGLSYDVCCSHGYFLLIKNEEVCVLVDNIFACQCSSTIVMLIRPNHHEVRWIWTIFLIIWCCLRQLFGSLTTMSLSAQWTI